MRSVGGFQVCRANPEPVFGAKAALARNRHNLGPPLRRNPFPVIEARFTDSRATGLPAAGRAEHPEAPRARAEFLAPHVTHGRKRPQSVAGCESRAAVWLTWLLAQAPLHGHILGSPRCTRRRSRAAI
jgi:hypothetical protein